MNSSKVVASIDVLSEQGSLLRLTEDSVFTDIEQATAGVFDGASDLFGFKTPDGLTGGAIASGLAVAAFKKLQPNQPLVEAARLANVAIYDAQIKYGIDITNKASRFCTTAAVARVRHDKEDGKVIDLLQVADSVAIVVYKDGRVEAPLGLYDLDQPSLELWMSLVAEGLRGTAARQDPRMKAQLEANRYNSNSTYGVLNGEGSFEKLMLTATVPANDIAKVLLLSDGLFIPSVDPLVPEDWSAYAQLEARGGLKAILDHVRSMEKDDPECVKYPRFKMSDDATGVVITLA